jgi:hypothetical protein
MIIITLFHCFKVPTALHSIPLGQCSYFTVTTTGILTAPDYFTLENNVLAHFIQNAKQNLYAFLEFGKNFEATTKCCFSHQ